MSAEARDVCESDGEKTERKLYACALYSDVCNADSLPVLLQTTSTNPLLVHSAN